MFILLGCCCEAVRCSSKEVHRTANARPQICKSVSPLLEFSSGNWNIWRSSTHFHHRGPGSLNASDWLEEKLGGEAGE